MNLLLEKIWARRFVFLSTFFLVFTLSYILLLALDFLPEPVVAEESVFESEQDVTGGFFSEEENELPNPTYSEEFTASEMADAQELSGSPIKISIKKLDKDITVLNPTSRTIADLDEALLSGVVRHPDSATLAQEGNVFILGHSSYLPNVRNQNFQAFNGIQKLEWGDIIEVYSEDSVYEYRVEKVYRARAQDVTVPIAGTGNMLTLATCNSFGSIDDRYIVEAKQVRVRGL